MIYFLKGLVKLVLRTKHPFSEMIRCKYFQHVIKMQTLTKALNYRIFKEQFETENYLHILDDNFLFEFCKFRTLNHKLPIEYGRWHNIARNIRFCNPM